MTITCIMCPLGCQIEGDKDTAPTGYGCRRGKLYAERELVKPMRVVTSLAATERGVLPCKTDGLVDKTKIFEVLAAIKAAKVTLPIKIGDIIIPNILDTDINVVATKELL